MTLDLSLLAALPEFAKLFAYLPQFIQVATALIAAASAIAAVLPHPAKLDGWLAAARKIVDWLALNIGHATPAGGATASASSASTGTALKSIAAFMVAGALGIASALGLAACAAPTTPQATVFDMRAAYDAAVLVPMVHYTALPACSATAPATLAAPCKNPAVVAQLIKADTSAEAAFDAAENLVRTNPTLDATSAIAAVTAAVNVAETIVSTYNIK